MSKNQLVEILGFLESFAPLDLAEDWDNVGLLLGDRTAEAGRVLTCLTITPEVVAEAIDGQIDLIVSHHPMPFRPLKTITTDSVTGRMVLDLIRNQIAVYSPHTAFDSTAGGINQMIAERIQLQNIQSLIEVNGWSDSAEREFDPDAPQTSSTNKVYGVGRLGELSTPTTCEAFARLLANEFSVSTVKACGNLEQSITRIGIACGSAGQFLSTATSLGCDAFITGETNFHTCLESQASNVSLFLLGHYGSERFAVERLAEILSEEFPALSIAASSAESDPIQYWHFG